MTTTPTSITTNPAPKNDERSWSNIGLGVALALVVSSSFLGFAYLDGLEKSAVVGARNAAGNGNNRVLAQGAETAILGDPLNQNLVNAALALRSGEINAEQREKWIAVLGKMGWRSTPALQTLISSALKTQDLDKIIVLTDALLRRRQLFDETVALTNLLEAEPTTHNAVVKRLKAGVIWRTDYLQYGGNIKLPAVIDGRIRTLRELQQGGGRLTRQELAPSVAAIHAAGRVGDAEALWRVHSAAAPAALHDPDFRIAVGAGAEPAFTFPFEWQFYSGSGFSAYPSEDGLNGAVVAIQWDGRGLPVFLRQQTAAKPGRYRFTFRVNGDAQKFATKIAVRFRCGSEITRTQNNVQPNSQNVSAETLAPVNCAYPWVDILGEIQDRGSAVDLAFSRVSLERLGK